jgi:hypothetical protein
MAKFTSNVPINSRWRNNDFIGDAGSTHTFPDALFDEFLIDWDQQLDNGNLVITETPTTGNIQVSTLTVGDIVLTGTATGNFNAGGGTTVIGTSPISVATSGSTATVSLAANYQTAGTYITAVNGSAPITASTNSAGVSTVSLTASYATSTHLHDADYVNVGGDTMSGQLHVSSATTTSTVGFGEIIVAKGTSFGSITVNATDDHLHLRSKNPIEVLVQSGPTKQGLRAKSIGVNSSTTSPTLVDDGITFGDDVNLYRVSANALKTDDALEVVGSLTNGGTSVSLSTHTHAYQPSGTYITAVNGTAPITASTSTAGVVTVALTASYDSAGTASSLVTAHEADTTNVHGITNTANLLTTTSGIGLAVTTTATATTISSTTATAPTDVTNLSYVFTPTYNENVLVNVNVVYTQSGSSTAIIDLRSLFILNGTIISPNQGFVRLAANHTSPTGLTMSLTHTFAAISGTPYTAKVACYKTVASGTYSVSNISNMSVLRVRE